MAHLDAPKLNEEIVISDVFQYVREVDNSFKDELEDIDSKAIILIEQLISLEISKYILFHIGGKRPFDQGTADTIGRLHREKMNEFKELTGKDYICKNNEW